MRAHALLGRPGEPQWLVRWKVQAPPALAVKLRRDEAVGQLVGHLRGKFGHRHGGIYSLSIDIQPPTRLPDAWWQEATIRGEFLRAIRSEMADGRLSADWPRQFPRRQLPESLSAVLGLDDPATRAGFGQGHTPGGRFAQRRGASSVKITQLRIDRFGVWSGLEVEQLTAPMVVFYGENEAGKTTLMQFVRTVLYGFSPARRDRYVSTRHGGTPGGSLTVDVAHQSLVIHRYLDVRSGEETLEVVDRDGQHHPLRGLARLLDGIDESVFNNVFAFGLREIQELATLSDSAAADLLYELTLGIDRVSLSDVVGQLQTSRERLLSDGEQPCRLLELWPSSVHRLRTEIENLRGSTPEYLATAKKHEGLNQSAQALEAEEVELDERLRMLTVAAQIEPRWHHRQEVERRRAALEPVPQLADDCLTRLAELKTRRETRRRRLAPSYRAPAI